MKAMNFIFTKHQNIGIFKFHGEILKEHGDELKLLLMRALHGLDRAVLNLKEVTAIDSACLGLLRKAYCTSVRLKNPIILTEVPGHYVNEIYNCGLSLKAEDHRFEGPLESPV